MKYCTSCGQVLLDEAKFCKYCGRTQQVLPLDSPVYCQRGNQQYHYTKLYRINQTATKPNFGNKKSRRATAVLFAIIGSILLCLVSALFVMKFYSPRGARSYEKAVDKLYQSFSTDNSRKALNVMMPTKMEKCCDELNKDYGTFDTMLEEVEYSLADKFSKDYEYKYAITERRRAKEKEEFDEYCETLIYPLCDSIKVTDIYILSIAVKCRNYGEKNWDSCVEYCIAYKTGGRWYIIPAELYGLE